jgi:heme-degrading monooxygenase HmoA
VIAATPTPPYYAVIFTSQRSDGDHGYTEAAARMVELAQRQPGFLGVESAREDGLGVTVSYWESEAAIRAWREDLQHSAARDKGRADWYRAFATRIARVERDYGFERPETSGSAKPLR